MDPLGHDAIWFRHLGDLREHVAFPLRPVLVRALFRLQLSGALLHRSFFLGRESPGALGGLLRGLLGGAFTWVHEKLLISNLWITAYICLSILTSNGKGPK